MRSKFALLGATMVACFAVEPALANHKHEDIGQAFKLAALALEKTDKIAVPLVTGSLAAHGGTKKQTTTGRFSKLSSITLEKTDEIAVPLITGSIDATHSENTAVIKDVVIEKSSEPAILAKKKKVKKRTRERLVAKINLSSQTMNIVVDGKLKHSWKISSGAKGFHTPTGSYKPYYMTSMHYSKKYNNAPMPHSVFFRGGYAVHATGSVRRLGNPASHGCVRLSPGNARKFFKLVQKYKKAGTRIKIAGYTPASRGLKKRYTRKKRRANRYSANSWSNFGQPRYTRTRVRRRSARTVRRISIRRNVRSNRRTVRNSRRKLRTNRRIVRKSRRRSSGRLMHWQF